MITCPACSAGNAVGRQNCSVCGMVLGLGQGMTVDHNPQTVDHDAAKLSPAQGFFVPGTKIASRYRIVSLAGRGGMGEVYRADDLKLGHTVALKFLPGEVEEGSRRFQLFLSEVRLSRQISHPNVCRVYDIGEVDGRNFLSMEYIDGEDLQGLLRRIGRLPKDKGIEIAKQLCDGLGAAHEKSVLHRDLKPANVMIDGQGQARLTDFGLARLEDGSPGFSEIAGTPAYMAPEQLARGETTIKSDLYSLGLILYEIFTGHPAHKLGSLEEMRRSHQSSTLPPSDFLPDLDPVIERAILHSLQRDPTKRPISARAVADALTGRDGSSPGPLGSDSHSHVTPSLAVLPFVNMSSEQENEFLSDGITEDLILALSRLKGLRVPARTSSFAFKGKNEDIRRIGQLLNVQTVLEGSVRKAGNKLRVTAKLVKVVDGFHIWSERYDCEMKDVFDIQDDITRSIVGSLEVQLGAHPESKLVRPTTSSTEAYELYIKGRIYWNQRGPGLKKALHYFELALLEDPSYALAWSGLADTYTLLGFYDFLPYQETMRKAKIAAKKAVALDESSAEAQCSLAFMLAYYGVDVPGSEHHFKKALELNSNYTPARYWYATVLLGMGRIEESSAQTHRAVEGDPLSKSAHSILGWMMVSPQWANEAVPHLLRCLELDPQFPLGRWLLGRAYWMQQKTVEALAELTRAVEFSERSPMCLCTLGWALALSGKTDEARHIQRELTARMDPAPTRPLYLASLHAALGENDLAFQFLEKALDDQDLFFLMFLPYRRVSIEPLLLESDPRWLPFLERVRDKMFAGSEATTPGLS